MTTLAAARPHPGSDFPDWLSPILVKELRQGLKSRVFVCAFLALQLALIVLLGLQLLSETYGMNYNRGDREMFAMVYWMIVAAPLLVVMPACGLNAVSSEAKAQTLDLVQLTRLTATRIVFGKWLSLVSQSLLLVATVLPYAMIRYYFGQVDILRDLNLLLFLLESSLLLTALAVMLSTLRLIPRIVALVVLAPPLLWCIAVLYFVVLVPYGFSRSFGPRTSGLGLYLLFPVAIFLCVAYLLEMAAGRIAPVTENHSGRRRLIALAAGLLTLGSWWLDKAHIYPASILLLSLVGWAVVEAICERTVTEPGMYRSMAKRGFAGRLCGRMFYPGWATGLVFATAVFAIALGCTAAVIEDRGLNRKDLVVALLFLVSVVLPVAVWPLVPRRFPLFGAWLAVQLLFGLFWLVGSLLFRDAGYFLISMVPASAAIEVLAWNANPLDHAPVACFVILLLAWRVWREFRIIRKLERDAVREPDPSAA